MKRIISNFQPLSLCWFLRHKLKSCKITTVFWSCWIFSKIIHTAIVYRNFESTETEQKYLLYAEKGMRFWKNALHNLWMFISKCDNLEKWSTHGYYPQWLTYTRIDISFGMPNRQTNGTVMNATSIPMINNIFGWSATIYSDLTGLHVIQQNLMLPTVR